MDSMKCRLEWRERMRVGFQEGGGHLGKLMKTVAERGCGKEIFWEKPEMRKGKFLIVDRESRGLARVGTIFSRVANAYRRALGMALNLAWRSVKTLVVGGAGLPVSMVWLGFRLPMKTQ